MRRDNIPLNSDVVNIRLISAKPSFLMYPLPLLRIGHKFKWKARFIVGTGYLYALCFNGQEAKTSYRELRKVLATNSTSRIQEFLDEIETLNRYVFSIVGSKHPERFVKTSKNGTEIELILPQDFSLIEANRAVGFFPVPKISFLMPVSAQAKALYIYLHYLKNRDNPTVITSANRLGKDLRLDRKKVKKYLSELEEINAISFESSRSSLKIIVKTPIHWKKEAFVKIVKIYGGEHPFMKDWKLERCTNRPQPGVPIDPNLAERCTNRPQPGVPIDPNLNSPRTSTSLPKKTPTTSNTTSKENTTSIYDAIYNGGEEKNNITNLFNSKKEIKKKTNSCESSQELIGKNIAPSYEKPNGFKSEENAGKLGKPNNRAGCSRLEERIDQQELEKIKKALSCIADAVQNLLNYYRIELKEEFYKPLKEIYGEQWKTIAGMYELFDRKEPRFGYSRKVNTNYLGLLISFALKDSQASFWEFYERFKKIFGVKEKQSQTKRRIKNKRLFEEVKALLKSYLSDKQAIYKTFVEKGILDLEEEGGVKILKCKDRIIADYVVRFLKIPIEKCLGRYEIDWKIEF